MPTIESGVERRTASMHHLAQLSGYAVAAQLTGSVIRGSAARRTTVQPMPVGRADTTRVEIRCDCCGYGGVVNRVPDRCPMCGLYAWEVRVDSSLLPAPRAGR